MLLESLSTSVAALLTHSNVLLPIDLITLSNYYSPLCSRLAYSAYCEECFPFRSFLITTLNSTHVPLRANNSEELRISL